MKNKEEYTNPIDFYKDLALCILQWADYDTWRRWDPAGYELPEDIEYAEESLLELAEWIKLQTDDTYLLRGT